MDRRKFLLGTSAATGLAGLSSLTSSTNALALDQGISSSTVTSSNAAKLARLREVNPAPLATASNDLTAYTGQWTDVQLWHILRRAMFGVPYAQFIAAKALGSMSAIVNKLIDATLPLPTK